MTNKERAQRALSALWVYCGRDGQNRADQINAAPTERAVELFEEVVSDLMCDLWHLADTLPLDPDWPALVERAAAHHDTEYRGEE